MKGCDAKITDCNSFIKLIQVVASHSLSVESLWGRRVLHRLQVLCYNSL